MTIVDRQTRCFLGIEPVLRRTQEVGQQLVDEAPAVQYYSDQFPLYDSLTWLNRHIKAFAHSWNQRQLHIRARPFDKKHVIDFICLQN